MSVVKRITIAGFRGVLAEMTIDLAPSGIPKSLVLYGRNGTGKSSITDAWEWLRNQRIEHLAREGAKESAYPHRAARNDETFVEIEFVDPALKSIRVDFDTERVTKPRISGDLPRLRERTPHPCHVRFTDLTRFVYLTKADRYDMLAQLMGFQPQVNYQKSLRRVEKSLTDDRDLAVKAIERTHADLCAQVNVSPSEPPAILEFLGKLFTRHAIAAPSSRAAATESAAALRDRVEKDPRAHRLARTRWLIEALSRFPDAQETVSTVNAFATEALPFRDEEERLKKVLLVGLYEQGLEFLKRAPEHDRCPLCGQSVDGDLATHLAEELEGLKHLQEQYSRIERVRKIAVAAMAKSWPKTEDLSIAASETGSAEVARLLETVSSQASHVRAMFDRLADLISNPASELSSERLTELRDSAETSSQASLEFGELVRELIQVATTYSEKLQHDGERKQLVEDYEIAAKILDRWEKALEAVGHFARVETTLQEFSLYVEDFVAKSLADVQSRFDMISSDVAEYFNILEAQTPGIATPVLRILADQDRAVVPEIVFHGESVFPAYKYLSESQLNSFGLAVFLASVKCFNDGFRLLILDDVVNSLDGYKRPQLLKILRNAFENHQILLFTHDTVWRDRIYREFPNWRRINFVRHDYGVGPIMQDGASTLDEIKADLANDRPRQAGQALGPFLEAELQELAEAFEVELKFNRRNEYTLEPLLDGVRLRCEKKLGKEHQLSLLFTQLRRESGFRNVTAHAKNPEIELTAQELKPVVDAWERIVALVRCQEETCRETLRYGDGAFVCSCRKTILNRLPKDGADAVLPPSVLSTGPMVGRPASDTILPS